MKLTRLCPFCGRNLSVFQFTKTDKVKDGYYDLYYFSKDFSRNLELLKHFTIFIDANPPKIEVDTSRREPQEAGNTLVTNLTIIMTAINPINLISQE